MRFTGDRAEPGAGAVHCFFGFVGCRFGSDYFHAWAEDIYQITLAHTVRNFQADGEAGAGFCNCFVVVLHGICTLAEAGGGTFKQELVPFPDGSFNIDNSYANLPKKMGDFADQGLVSALHSISLGGWRFKL